MANGKSIKERLVAVEIKLAELVENHIPHLDAKMDKVLFWVFTTLFGFALSIIGGLVLLIVKVL